MLEQWELSLPRGFPCLQTSSWCLPGCRCWSSRWSGEREQAQNKDLKEKHKRRKKYADERRLQLVAALQESNQDSSERALLNV